MYNNVEDMNPHVRNLIQSAWEKQIFSGCGANVKIKMFGGNKWNVIGGSEEARKAMDFLSKVSFIHEESASASDRYSVIVFRTGA